MSSAKGEVRPHCLLAGQAINWSVASEVSHAYVNETLWAVFNPGCLQVSQPSFSESVFYIFLCGVLTGILG